jgi:hypothetical protein
MTTYVHLDIAVRYHNYSDIMSWVAKLSCKGKERILSGVIDAVGYRFPLLHSSNVGRTACYARDEAFQVLDLHKCKGNTKVVVRCNESKYVVDSTLELYPRHTACLPHEYDYTRSHEENYAEARYPEMPDSEIGKLAEDMLKCYLYMPEGVTPENVDAY